MASSLVLWCGMVKLWREILFTILGGLKIINVGVIITIGGRLSNDIIGEDTNDGGDKLGINKLLNKRHILSLAHFWRLIDTVGSYIR